MVKYDSEIGDKVISTVKEAGASLKSDISGKILSDYSALTSVGLFSSQLQTICDSVNNLAGAYESFASLVSQNKEEWIRVQEESKTTSKTYASGVSSRTSSGGYTYTGGASSRSSSGTTSSAASASTQNNVDTVSKGKEISINDVKELLSKVDTTVMPVLLKKIKKLSNGESLVDLLTDTSKSNVITTILKKILGDTTSGEISADLDTETIQKLILSKLNTDNIDITTEEGKNQVEKIILEYLNKEVDESKWNQILYGDNTTKVEALGNTWVVAKTAQDLNSYVSYVQSNGVKQDANAAEWGDSCLAFAGAHTYDLYNGTQTSGSSAAGYAHAGAYEDFISDSKEETLSKIYDEIMSGKPVVLQVNGNKAGTSRHFVTVVGFKDGVVSGSTLQESDLLIIDSWDGKLESMDTDKSRFMTTGAACGKDYSGYRLRVFKS